ncbi:hypothetical protein [Roseimicrobium sp. ORNL1]|uniref:hypothetical protein n=1 Tax=Roseimicrobium sp. ORNL1 TaxID=2711231 RepID=UPI0013E1A503|nr:hypothetical protein [Roseimicrobium sp. ORNL1]QIF01919.1 hypothetical protein G5S37_10390 [Roseimicrobium sp. ORNL1]
MNDPFKILQIALSKSGVAASDAIDIALFKDKDKDLWECSIATEKTKEIEPGFIRIQVYEGGARVIPML